VRHGRLRDLRDATERRHRAILGLAALDKSNFAQVLRRILEVDADELGVARVNCWTLDPEFQGLRCVCGVVHGCREVERGVILRRADIPHYIQALTIDPIILADDARSDPRTCELRDWYLVPIGITSMMDVPIWVRGRLWGVICHEHVGASRHWTEADRDFAVSIGHIVSMAVEARDRAEAERVARSSEFSVGILSHDLRNPLNAVRLAATYILTRMQDATSPDEEVTASARRIVDNVGRMSRMVEQLLDFTRIRVGGGIPVQREAMDMGEVSRRAVAQLEAANPEHAISLKIDGDTRGAWDRDRLWQLLSNVVGNAVEHGKDARVAVDGRDPDLVILEVRNRGRIAPEFLPEIFEPFQRSQGSTGGGVGLGLFIAREIVTAHSGSITLDSGENETVFTIRLPRFGNHAPVETRGTST
jgi:signal transduction histidine kinase